MLMDHTGAFKVEGWADDWNHQYTLLEVGDVVALANVGLDAWASEVRPITRETRGFKFSSVSTAQPPDEMVVTSNTTSCLSGVECGRTVPS